MSAAAPSLTPSTQYSISVSVTLQNRPGVLGELATAIGRAGGSIFAIDGFVAKGPHLDRDIVINCTSVPHQAEIIAAIEAVGTVELHSWYDRTFHLHEGGKIEVLPLCPVGDRDDLSMAYTPGVARVCNAIAADETLADRYTIRRNTVAIVSDGTAVLGLGDIGPKAALPVMEGKALLFKEFADVDGFPIVLDVASADELIETVERIAPTFGGINLEDIAAPAAFYVEEELKRRLDIPVFHDDQHGTAVVSLAALRNAAAVVEKRLSDMTVVISGIGAAGVAIGKILLNAGVAEVIGTDRKGAIYEGRDDLNEAKQWFAAHTNRANRRGSLGDVLTGADVFIGVSAPGVVSIDDIHRMAEDPIVFAMANPDPEILPEEAGDSVAVMATGRSDYPNQINNVLAFPGIFRGAFDARATDITENMKLAAAQAIADAVDPERRGPDYIIPSVFDKTVPAQVAAAVADAARSDRVARS